MLGNQIGTLPTHTVDVEAFIETRQSDCCIDFHLVLS